jgi:type I restriction enzyme, S subunit
MIPDGWSIESLADAGVTVIDGDRGKEYPKATDFSDAGFCLFLSAKNVTKRGFQFDDVQFISKEKHSKLRKGLVKRGSLVLTTRGSVGQFAYYEDSVPYDAIRINSGMVILDSDNSSVNADYLYALCRSPIVERQIESASFGSAQPQLTVGLINNLKLPVPPITEQKKIAKILTTWDKAITTTERLLVSNQQQKKALKQQLLSGKRRLPGFSGEWVKKPISSFIKESRVQGSTGDKARKLTVKLYGLGVVPKGEKRIGSESTKYYRRSSGQFIYSKLDFLNGAFGVIPRELDGYESTLDLPAFDFRSGVNANWFVYYVSREEFYSSNLGLANGGRKARRVNPKDLLGIKIPTPGSEEQQKIALVLSAVDCEAEALQKKIEYLKREKKALMQQLLAGKRRVSVIEKLVDQRDLTQAKTETRKS